MAAITVVAKAEFAQSYMVQARTARCLIMSAIQKTSLFLIFFMHSDYMRTTDETNAWILPAWWGKFNRFSDHKMPPPFFDISFLDAGLQNQVVFSHVHSFKHFCRSGKGMRFQVNKITAGAAGVEGLVLKNPCDPVQASPALSVHQVNHFSRLQFEEMLSRQVIVRNQPDIPVPECHLKTGHHA